MEIYTPDEVANKLKVSKRTVYGWLQNGKLMGFKVGTMWRIRKEALEEFTGMKWDDESE